MITADTKTAVQAEEGNEQRQAHISICVCTYRRPDFLRRTLLELLRQQTDGLFTFSIVVADNDAERSGEAVVNELSAASKIAIRYCVEPRQNIALARNKAVENASGNFIAFIDDDEIPLDRWLLKLFSACRQYNAAGALGPVLQRFDEEPPRWVVKGKFYDRPTYPTGLYIDWRKGRTGNVLLKREIFNGLSQPFRPEFLTGEDQDFFRRMIESGHRFVWCAEAVAHETVPPIRWNLGFMLRRALLRGAVSCEHPSFGARDVMKSVIALPLYVVALPFALLAGRHHFISLMIKTCDHAGRLLALAGIKAVKQTYVTE